MPPTLQVHNVHFMLHHTGIELIRVQEYIHMIGRAGRLGTPGMAIAFINNSSKSTLSFALSFPVPNSQCPFLPAILKFKQNSFATW
jgi:hypothetical protein